MDCGKHGPRGSRWAWLALAWLGGSGCGPQASDRPSDRRWVSEHFEYLSRSGDEVCPDVLNTLEAHFEVLHAYLGMPTSLDRPIRYEKYRDAADFAANSGCDAGSAGCFADGTVRSWSRVDEHELVHAYLSQLPRPPPLLEEGVAEALSCGVRPRAAPTTGWRDALALGSSLDAYAAGGWLVGSLLRAAGPEPLLQLYGSVAADADADVLASAFAVAYGSSLDDAWARAVASDDPATACASVWECAAPPVALGAEPIAAESCAEDIAWGTFGLLAPASVTWRTDGEWSAQLGRCGEPGAPQSMAQRTPGASGHLGATWLSAGDYFAGHHGSGSIAVAADALPWSGAACDSLQPYVLPATVERVHLDVPQSVSPWWAAVQLVAPGTVVVELAETDPTIRVQVCPSCTSPVDSCVTLASGGRAGIADASALVFRVDAQPTGDRFTSLLLTRQ